MTTSNETEAAGGFACSWEGCQALVAIDEASAPLCREHAEIAAQTFAGSSVNRGRLFEVSAVPDASPFGAPAAVADDITPEEQRRMLIEEIRAMTAILAEEGWQQRGTEGNRRPHWALTARRSALDMLRKHDRQYADSGPADPLEAFLTAVPDPPDAA